MGYIYGEDEVILEQDELYQAVKRNDLQTVERLLEDDPDCVRYANYKCWEVNEILLLWANSPEMASLLLTHNADISYARAPYMDCDLLTELYTCEYYRVVYIAMLTYGIDTSLLEEYHANMMENFPRWINKENWEIVETIKCFRSIFKEREAVFRAKEKTLLELMLHFAVKTVIPNDISDTIFSYL